MRRVLILDTAQSVKELHEMAMNCGEMPEFFINVVQELLERMQDSSSAELLVRGFITNIREGRYLESEDYRDSIESFYAQAIADVASVIYNQLAQLNIYRQGKLPFRLHLPNTHYIPYDIMLVELSDDSCSA